MEEIDSYHAARTYSGMMSGLMTVETAISYANMRIEQMWGKGRPVHVVFPTLDGQVLPTWTHTVWATSSVHIVDPDADGSHLFLVWFSNEPPGKEDINAVIDGVEWEKLAKDFWY